MTSSKSFRDLESHWYQKLEEQGFQEIENLKSRARPLKEWHSFKLISERVIIRQAKYSQYQVRIDDFSNHPSFHDACKFIANRKNCTFTEEQIALVWELHRTGLTRRAICKRLGRVKSRIDDIIRDFRQWMNLV